jgi:hypothetical protein
MVKAFRSYNITIFEGVDGGVSSPISCCAAVFTAGTDILK